MGADPRMFHLGNPTVLQMSVEVFCCDRNYAGLIAEREVSCIVLSKAAGEANALCSARFRWCVNKHSCVST